MTLNDSSTAPGSHLSESGDPLAIDPSYCEPDEYSLFTSMPRSDLLDMLTVATEHFRNTRPTIGGWDIGRAAITQQINDLGIHDPGIVSLVNSLSDDFDSVLLDHLRDALSAYGDREAVQAIDSLRAAQEDQQTFEVFSGLGSEFVWDATEITISIRSQDTLTEVRLGERTASFIHPDDGPSLVLDPETPEVALRGLREGICAAIATRRMPYTKPTKDQ